MLTVKQALALDLSEETKEWLSHYPLDHFLCEVLTATGHLAVVAPKEEARKLSLRDWHVIADTFSDKVQVLLDQSADGNSATYGLVPKKKLAPNRNIMDVVINGLD